MSFLQLFKSIRRQEWLVVTVVAAATSVLVSLPPLLGWLSSIKKGLEWTGLSFFSPGDFGVYLSYIRQTTSGSPWLVNLFTTFSVEPVLNPFWWLVGRFADWLSLGPITAFYLVRTCLVPILAVVVYLTIAVFLSRPIERLVAFLILSFGSGWGVLILRFLPIFSGDTPEDLPIDLWIAESNIFASQLHSPHFIASWILLLSTVLFIVLTFKSGACRYSFLSGFLALLLFLFHPFYAPVLYGLGLFGLIIFKPTVSQSKFRKFLLVIPLVFFSLPAVIYHYLVLHGSLGAREITAANVTLTPSWFYLLIGLGLPLFLMPLGWRIFSRRSPQPANFLLSWALFQLVLIYLPFSFQRRWLEGLQFPLVVLSTPLVMSALQALRPSLNFKFKHWLVGLLLLVSLITVPISSIYIWLTNIRASRGEMSILSFFSPAQSLALDWIRNKTPVDSSFMAFGSSGYWIAGWTGRRVLFGHWVNSGDASQRQKEVQQFFFEFDNQQRINFMKDKQLTHVFISQEEILIAESLAMSDQFVLKYKGDDIQIYQLVP